MNGKKEGEEITFSRGNRSSYTVSHYKNGLLEGRLEEYRRGFLYYVCNYKNGSVHGASYAFHDNGVIWYTVAYENGKIRDGNYFEFDGDGNVIIESIYKNGKLDKKFFYNEKGKVIKSIE